MLHVILLGVMLMTFAAAQQNCDNITTTTKGKSRQLKYPDGVSTYPRYKLELVTLVYLLQGNFWAIFRNVRKCWKFFPAKESYITAVRTTRFDLDEGVGRGIYTKQDELRITCAESNVITCMFMYCTCTCTYWTCSTWLSTFTAKKIQNYMFHRQIQSNNIFLHSQTRFSWLHLRVSRSSNHTHVCVWQRHETRNGIHCWVQGAR